MAKCHNHVDGNVGVKTVHNCVSDEVKRCQGISIPYIAGKVQWSLPIVVTLFLQITISSGIFTPSQYDPQTRL